MAHCVVHSLDAAVAAGVIGARGDFAGAQKFVYRGRELGAELRATVKEQCRGTAPDGDEPVDENVGRSFGSEFRFGDGEHVSTAAEAVREEEDVGVSSSRGWKGPGEEIGVGVVTSAAICEAGVICGEKFYPTLYAWFGLADFGDLLEAFMVGVDVKEDAK